MKAKSKTASPRGNKNTAGVTDNGSDHLNTALQKLFENELKDIYWAEKALVKALPKMIRNSVSEELTSALQQHLSETEEQVKRLERVFEIIDKKVQAKKCEAMEGLIKEANRIMDESEKGVMRDAAIIAGQQKTEHYEIATYGTLRSFAQTLGLEEAASLLEESLTEEKSADERLTQVAESFINVEAANVREE